LVPVPSQIYPVHTIPLYLRSVLILYTHLHLGLPSGLFPCGFATNILKEVRTREETDEKKDEQEELWEDRDRETLLLGDPQKSGNVGGVIIAITIITINVTSWTLACI
jgi:hypothetical protein